MKPALNREKRRLKYAATINDEALPEGTDPDYELQYIDIGNVDSAGTIHEIATYVFEKAPSRARRIVRDGDVIISTVRTYLQAIAAIKDPENNLIVSTGFAVVRPRNEVLHTGFCKYALRAPRFIQEVEARSVGVSYPAIKSSELGDIRIDLPPMKVQEIAARYLDRETLQIDRLIAEKEQLLLLLKEKWIAASTRIIMCGLDANARFKATKQPWFSEIPSHWNLDRAKRLFREIDDRSVTGEETLFSLRMDRGLVPYNDVSEKLIPAENLVGYKIARPGEIVLNRMRAASGLVAVAPQHGIVSPDYAVFRALDAVDPDYFTLLFKTPLLQAVFRSLSTGLGTGESGFLRLYSEDFLNVKIPVPPFDEQEVIVSELARQRTRTANVEEALQSSIKLLKERRAALITAAVTGQIEPEVMSA